MADAKNGIEMVKSEFTHEKMDGKTYWFPDSKPPAKKKSPIAYLLPNYDEYFIGFKDRSAIGNRITWSNLDESSTAFIAHILFMDGQIVGGWKRILKKNEVVVQLNILTNLTKLEKQAVAAVGQRYGEFLGLPLSLNF